MAFDVLFVGGGLASGLGALALRRRHPRLRIGLIEAGPGLGGNHTWCCFDSDLDEAGRELCAPLVAQRWPGVEVAFADHLRRLPTGYAAITSASFDRGVRPAFAAPGSALLLGRRVTRIGASEVELEGGERLAAGLVLDGRGPPPAPRWAENHGFQKFLGLEVATAGGHATDVARVMDADLPQSDGLRFIYMLPLSPTRLLVEETYFSDRPELDRDLLRARIGRYLDARGIVVRQVVREETGVLAMPWTDDTLPPLGSPLRLGARGGWFHPATGYTLPVAVRVAAALATPDPFAALAALRRRLEPQLVFARRLNRLLFRAVAPEHRWQVMSRFYRLPRPLIERFYALGTTPLDRARILLGRPPEAVSVRAAFSALQTV